MAVDTMGRLLALHVTPASEGDRAAVAALADAVQDATNESVTLACVDSGCTGENAASAAQAHGITLEVVKLPSAKRGFVLPPRRWVSSAASPGCRACDGWPAATSACRKPSQRCTSSLSPCSCRTEPILQPQSTTASRKKVFKLLILLSFFQMTVRHRCGNRCSGTLAVQEYCK